VPRNPRYRLTKPVTHRGFAPVSLATNIFKSVLRRKSTLINKAHDLTEFCDVDVALIIRNRRTGRYFTYNSVDLKSWPPSKANRKLLALVLKVAKGATNGKLATVIPGTGEPASVRCRSGA
jgi:hypothetical protein